MYTNFAVESHYKLNDEVINAYMDLITKRSPDTVYAFNTFFYSALSKKGYSHVSCWTKKIDIFSKKQLFIPVYINEFFKWSLIYISFEEKAIKYYDSFGGSNFPALELILKYLMFEHIDKKETNFIYYDWSLTNIQDNPIQLNIFNCGVFICVFAEYISRNAPLSFSREDVKGFRKQIYNEIENKKLIHEVMDNNLDDKSHLMLNDEVINAYMDLITKRSPDTVYAFNTFFYSALSKKGYSHVSCWTKKIDIFSKKQLFIPVHTIENSEWSLIYVCFEDKAIKYYDSIGGSNFSALELILKYLMFEHIDKKETNFPNCDWSLHNMIDNPRQLNIFDCGVFICMFAEYISRNAPLNFFEEDVKGFRNQIYNEIENKKLIHEVMDNNLDDKSHLMLNDEVINAYMDLITKRSPDTVYAFNTFFYSALSKKGYSHVSCWTKKIDIFSKKQLFIPVHIKERSKWSLIYVSFEEKAIKYYDSVGGSNFSTLNLILKYLMFEHVDKKETNFLHYDWSLTNLQDNSRQLNNFDCGVFICMFAEYISRNAPLNFSEEDVKRFRNQIFNEIINKELIHSVL